MRSRKPKKVPIKSLTVVGQALSAIGTPPLFAIKILLWTAVWLANSGLKTLKAGRDLLSGISETSLWLTKTIVQSIKIVKTKIKILQLPKISIPKITISVPKINFPKIHKRLFVRPRPVGRLKNKPSFIFKLRYLIIGAVVFFLFAFIPYWVKSQLDLLPNPRLLTVRDIPVSTKIYDRNGTLLYQIYSGENRTIVPLDQLPHYVPDATVAIEDKNFYHHFGFDPAGIARAFFVNSRGNSNHQGGSTITQQLIKSALLSPQQTFTRKIKELILAFWAERIYSKKEILTMYLNQVPYGGAAYGIEEASQTYFKKSARDLTLAQAALLAGLPSAPTTYSPLGSYPELAKERQIQVLNAMKSQKFITDFQMSNTQKEELKFAPIGNEIKAPHFVMFVKDYLINKYGIKRVERGGLEVVTSLDFPTQENVNRLLTDGVDKQKYLNVGNGATLVTSPKTGEILAMVGSRDFFDLNHDGNVNVTIAQRSPGSSIKPLNYALAFEKGLVTPGTIIDDSPVTYRSAGSTAYAPTNYDNKFHGKVTVRVALASSYNIPAVKVLEKNGLDNFLDFSKKLGITTFVDRSRFGLALTLGGGEIKMIDMATAFSAFANAGLKVDLKPVLKVTDFRGNILENNVQVDSRVLSPQTAFLISSILSDDRARAPTFGAGSVLNIANHTVSVKTGTTETKRDNWTIGYTPSVLAAVWVGNNDNTPMSPFLESGNTGAAAIWNPIMTSLLKDRPNEPAVLPDNIVSAQICSLNGLLTCENCPSTRTEYFTKGTEPKFACKITKEDLEKMAKEKEEKKD